MAQTVEAELIRCARNVARLQTRRRRLKRELKKIDADLKLERRHLRGLAMADREPDIVPSRLFGAGVGHRLREREAPQPAKAVNGETDAFIESINADKPEKKAE
jgi:hypothetical protein